MRVNGTARQEYNTHRNIISRNRVYLRCKHTVPYLFPRLVLDLLLPLDLLRNRLRPSRSTFSCYVLGSGCTEDDAPLERIVEFAQVNVSRTVGTPDAATGRSGGDDGGGQDVADIVMVVVVDILDQRLVFCAVRHGRGQRLGAVCTGKGISYHDVPLKESPAGCVARRLDTRHLDPITATKPVQGSCPHWSFSGSLRPRGNHLVYIDDHLRIAANLMATPSKSAFMTENLD